MPSHSLPPVEIPPLWAHWRRTLRRWGGVQAVIALLEAFGPLTILAAQFLYLGQPFWGRGEAHISWQSLANLLEDSEQQRVFVQFLQESKSQ